MLFFVKNFLVLLFSVGAFASGRPKHGSEDWRDILLKPIESHPHYQKIVEERAFHCDKAASDFKRRGFLTFKMREFACDHLCFNVVDDSICGIVTEKPKFKNVVSSLKDWAAVADELTVDRDIVETWYAILWRTWPLLMPLIPVLLQQYKYYNWYWATFFLFFYGVIFSFFRVSKVEMFYNLLIVVCCLASASTHGLVPEVVGGTATLLAFVLTCFLADPIVQLFVAVAILMIYMLWIVQVFFYRRHGAVAGILIMCGVVLVMFGQIDLLRHDYRLDTFSMNVLEMVLNSILPSGDSFWFLKNAFRYSIFGASNLTKMFDWFVDYELQLFFIFSILQLVMFAAFRALFGAFIILTMRYRNSPENVVKGFTIYMCDVFSGPWYAVSVVFGFHKFDERRALYSVVATVFLFFELRCALDVVFIRVIFSFFDAVIFQTCFYKLPKYLNYDMGNTMFPQAGSLPWMSLDSINDAAAYVYRLHTRDDNGKPYCGLGFIRRDGSRNYMMTVKHVLKGMRRMSYGNREMTNPKCSTLSCQDDPVACISVPDKGYAVPLIEETDVDFVRSLYFIKRDIDDSDRLKTCTVVDWKITKHGEINAVVDLQKGDSGGPVFAVLDTGKLRYCGCVTAGNIDIHGGNYISSVLCVNQPTGRIDSDSEAESVASRQLSKQVTFDTRLDDADLSASVSSANRLVKSFTESLGVWFYDESEENPEVRHFDKQSDVVRFLESRRRGDGNDDDVKIDSDDPGSKGRKGKFGSGKYRRTKKELYSSLSLIQRLSDKMFDDSLEASEYMKEVRYGRNPILSVNRGFIEFKRTVDPKLGVKNVQFHD